MEMLLINRYYYYYFYYYYYHYYYTFKNSGLSLSLPTIIFMCEHSSFKRVITPSNFATTISWLFVLARKDPGTAFPFNSLLGRFQINIKALFRIIFCFSKI